MFGPFIFLDIDGVLNKHDAYANGYCGIDPICMSILNNIIHATNAKIVVSSAWRYFVLRGEMSLVGFQGMMCSHGLQWGTIVDLLPADIPDDSDKCSADRGIAVKDWLRTRYSVSHRVRYVALDDLDLGYTKHGVRFIQTDSKGGLAGLPSRVCDSIVRMLKE